MLISPDRLRIAVQQVLEQRLVQGCDIDRGAFEARILQAGESYDALHALALELRDPPLRADWPFREPVDWADIVTEADRLDPDCAWAPIDESRARERVTGGFLGSVAGCMLGKPIEVDPTLAELKAAAGDEPWPLADYVNVGFLERLGRRHDSWPATVREQIDAVAADDDIHYTVIGMLLLERHGPAFTAGDIYRIWTENMPPAWCWGPERTALLGLASNLHHLFPEASVEDCHDVLFLNPGDEMCGALIRADAYGYACPGNPDLAAWLAWKDASFTHIRTGVYGPMFIAALIALCHSAGPLPAGNARLELVDEALRRVPMKSRFSEVVRDATELVSRARDWEAGYASVHGRYAAFSHCQVYQEIGTLVNTLKFAESIGHGIGLQVSQGNDTDSFGATAGSILGVLFGAESLEERWLAPFNDTLKLALADFHEHSLNRLARRMSRLPGMVYARQSGRSAQAAPQRQ